MPELDDLIPTTEAATILERTVWSVLRLAASGKLEVVAKAPGPRGAHLYRRADVEALRDEQTRARAW